ERTPGPAQTRSFSATVTSSSTAVFSLSSADAFGKPANRAGRSRSKHAAAPDGTKRRSTETSRNGRGIRKSPGATEGESHEEGIRDRRSGRSRRPDRVRNRRDLHGLQRPLDGDRQLEAGEDRRLARYDAGGHQDRGGEGGPAEQHQLPDDGGRRAEDRHRGEGTRVRRLHAHPRPRGDAGPDLRRD